MKVSTRMRGEATESASVSHAEQPMTAEAMGAHGMFAFAAVVYHSRCMWVSESWCEDAGESDRAWSWSSAWRGSAFPWGMSTKLLGPPPWSTTMCVEAKRKAMITAKLSRRIAHRE